MTRAGNWKVLLTAVVMLLFVVPAYAQTEDARVSNIFVETFILDALNDISIETGVPIIADSSVSGFVTMELDDVPLEEALTRICVPFGYTFRLMPEGYYLVGAADVNSPTFAILSETAVVKTKYLTAATVSKLLSDFYKPFIKVDETLNTLVVTGSPELIKRIEADIAKIDIPIRQVLLEVLVVELAEDARRALGTEWQWEVEKPSGKESSGTLTFTAASLGSLFAEVSHTHPAGLTSFLLSLKLIVEQGGAKIHANPRIVTMDGHQADIFLGQEQSYLVLTESDSTSGTAVTRQRVIIKTGVTLRFLPQVSPTGDVTVKVKPEVSSTVGFNKDGYPIIASRRASTTVRVKDGETFVIGGFSMRLKAKTCRRYRSWATYRFSAGYLEPSARKRVKQK